MREYVDQIYEGTIKFFNGQFGFIKSDLGDTYFHKSGILNNTNITIGDVVVFKIEPSTKKEGAYQAAEITLIKKTERPTNSNANSIIGILKWFDKEKGYGIIGTPENQDYFLHKSNLQSRNAIIKSGMVIVFEEKVEENKKAAINCRLAENYEDWQLALNYLSKNDIVTIQNKVIGASYRFRNHYSYQAEQISLLEKSSFQIFYYKHREDIIKIISDYFISNLQDKSSEEQLLYFIFIKKIFENSLMKDGSEILTRFFSRFKAFVVCHQDLIFSLWLKGYTQEKDLTYVAEKLTEEDLASSLKSINITLGKNKFNQIFGQLKEAHEQVRVLGSYLASLGTIDNAEKYNRVKQLVDLKEIREEAKRDYVDSAFKQSDEERKYLLWFQGYTKKKNLNYIIKKVTEGNSESLLITLKKIFEQLEEVKEQAEVLNGVLSDIDVVDCTEKYRRIKSLVALAEINKQVRVEFLTAAFEKCDEERKFLLWIEGYTQKKNVSYIVKFLIEENLNSHSLNPFKHVFKQLKDPKEQSQVLNTFLITFGIIDGQEKYNRIKSLIDLAEIDNQVMTEFLTSAFEQCDEERKYLLWLEGQIQEKELSYIAKKLSIGEVNSFSNPFEPIFEQLKDANEQVQVLNKFLFTICLIDNPDKYRRIKFLLDTNGISEQVKKDFLTSAFEQCDEERKFLLWFEDYIQKKSLFSIIKKLLKTDVKLDSDFFEELFLKLEKGKDQLEVLKGFLSEIGIIDDPEKYNRIKQMIDVGKIDRQSRAEFLDSVFEQCDEERKFLLWLEGYTKRKNISYIIEKLTEEHFSFYLSPFKNIFKQLGEGKDQSAVLNGLLSEIGNIDNSQKYDKIVSLIDLSELDEEFKANFLEASFKQCDEENKVKLFLEYSWQYTFPSHNEILSCLLGEMNISMFFGFCTQLVEPLSQINTHHYHNGLSFLKIFLEKTEYIKETNKRYGSSSIFKYKNVLLTEERFRNKLNNFKLALSYIEVNKNKLIHQIKNETDKKSFEDISESLKQFKSFCAVQDQICSDLSIPGPLGFSELEFCFTENYRGVIVNKFLLSVGGIDSDEKYKRVKSFMGLEEVDEKGKLDFLNSCYKQCDEENKVKLFLEYSWQYTFPNHNEILSCLLGEMNISLFFSFCTQLAEPLSQINTNKNYNGFSFLKIYLEHKKYIEKVNNSNLESLKFRCRNVLLKEDHFSKKLNIFKYILSYIEVNKDALANKIQNVIEKKNFEGVAELLKHIKSYFSVQEQLCLDLNTYEPVGFKYFEPYFIERCSTSELMKFWVHGLINHFDFSAYCFYYFILTPEERKIFNKKAKAIMGEEIKASMLKKREPWQLLDKFNEDGSDDLKYYTASWKSIWFNDGSIRIIKNKDADFSEPFPWDFSEEKFNLLFEYISGRRLKELTIEVKNEEIVSIDGLEELKEVIWKIQIQKEISMGGGQSNRGIGNNKIPINMILRNQCIQLLNQFQLNDLEPTRVLEKTFNIVKSGVAIDISLLFSIPINNYEVAIIWESLELEKSKATHIFKCTRGEYESVFSEIELYLSASMKVRSSLNSNNSEAIQHQHKLRYLCRIDHDNFDFSKWENSLYEILPELKEIAIANE